jgi:hypothetical protein
MINRVHNLFSSNLIPTTATTVCLSVHLAPNGKLFGRMVTPWIHTEPKGFFVTYNPAVTWQQSSSV